MNTPTYYMLPSDVLDSMSPGSIVIDESVPTGHVDVGRHRVPVDAFVRARRRARKRERQNKRRGRA